MKQLSSVLVIGMFLILLSAPAFGEEPPKAPAVQSPQQTETKDIMLDERLKAIEKKLEDVEKKAEKGDKKALRDRVNISGEARFRIMREMASTDQGFYGNFAGKSYPKERFKDIDQTSFPLRVRLNLQAEVVPDVVNFYARLTMNKRWGAYDTTATDPLNKPNSFESSIGHDMNPRFEQAYTTIKMLSMNTTWYIGRLPGEDGAPSRQAGTLFPRLFIDSEIDGTLFKWDAPQTGLAQANLPWTKTRLWGKKSDKSSALKSYDSKVNDKTGIIVGYLKYDEMKLSKPDDADVVVAQAQVKIGTDTALVLSGLFMDEWHMPNTSGYKYDGTNTLDLKTPYYLGGVYADTQLLGFQLYGAGYYSHFRIPAHSWTNGSTGSYPGGGFPGRIWYIGFNTGDLVDPEQQLCVEFAKGSDAWINPFNYRGYRRKGTVSTPAASVNYDNKSTVGFYPFNAEVWDVYYDYYYKQKTRFRVGVMDFKYDKHDSAILGSSKYQHDWWPYFEVNIVF
jgi:hypothetical protein